MGSTEDDSDMLIEQSSREENGFVSSKGPSADRLRNGLNVESGLNEGLCVPILFLLIVLALDTPGRGETAALAARLEGFCALPIQRIGRLKRLARAAETGSARWRMCRSIAGSTTLESP